MVSDSGCEVRSRAHAGRSSRRPVWPCRRRFNKSNRRLPAGILRLVPRRLCDRATHGSVGRCYCILSKTSLEQGCSCADSKAATFCANLLALYPALWLFASIEGVEPTNNHVERILRLGVLWRKNSFGCHSAAGCRFVERMLTVVQTLRL